ncbi:Dolichyl-phosphate-mannose-protein mannosyltransferase-domain-containing protein [Limtongia smithiae]|uniref:Dolichyl-phosphate-mannose-protein mannosyltransferase-domain-containing protein n=1 Tax=Limtongia smithiae TaxID=1125753 RepID=UPI0034CF75FB
MSSSAVSSGRHPQAHSVHHRKHKGQSSSSERKSSPESPKRLQQYYESDNRYAEDEMSFESFERYAAPLLFTVLAFASRMYKIGASDIVTWDEAHFGKFGSHYLKREFYFDVHPPLGKMLVGLSGFLCGYNGSFEFKSGEHYPPEINYTFMRLFNATFGALCVPVAFFTARSLKFSTPAVWLVSLMVLCENSYATISRFILLDSMLMLFTFTSFMGLAKFHEYKKLPFSLGWWFWLVFTGANIGFVTSVKWVGMLTTALIGIYTVHELWDMFGDLKLPKTIYAKHWAARIMCLIIIPFAIYLASFKIHFLILENSGPGDAQMPSLFQANLRHSPLTRSPVDIVIGSKVTIKNMGYGGGLLHSHVQTYPEGSEQQQVTCYHHKDANNEWVFLPVREEEDYNPEDPELRYIKNGDTIRLSHHMTSRNLHSHSVAAPVTKAHWEVSCYGNATIGDEKDYWVVEILKDTKHNDQKMHTLTSTLRFKHKELGCYLRAANVNLPPWGFKQVEVTCDKENHMYDPYTFWNIEQHDNEKLPPGDASAYKSPFLRDFVHLNVAMLTTNNALIPDPDKQDELASKPWQWPLLNVGLRMCGWNDDIIKYYLLGNPVVIWGSTVSIVLLVLMTFVYLCRWQRHYTDDLTPKQVDHYIYAGIYPALGWVLHYVPFQLMARVTYVHHYLPALYFAILTFGFCFDFVTKQLFGGIRFGKIFLAASYLFTYATVVGVFWLFSPISFGMVGSHEQYEYLNWLDTWKI